MFCFNLTLDLTYNKKSLSKILTSNKKNKHKNYNKCNF